MKALSRSLVAALALSAATPTVGVRTALAQTTAPQAAPATSVKTCKDGTTSTATGRGACSSHGGVASTAAAPGGGKTGRSPTPSGTATPAGTTVAPSGTAAAPAGSTAVPSGSTAKCKDGTYSKSKSHSGACSKHGGVDQWLAGSA